MKEYEKKTPFYKDEYDSEDQLVTVILRKVPKGYDPVLVRFGRQRVFYFSNLSNQSMNKRDAANDH